VVSERYGNAMPGVDTGLGTEKYIFLVRHAQSTWNREVDHVKTLRHRKFPELSVKDVLWSSAQIMTREVWHTDHPISDEGVHQTQELRQKIEQVRLDGPDQFHGALHGKAAGNIKRGEAERHRIRRFYERFLSQQQQIYCSPLLRALQTAHLALPNQEGWGTIKLMKEAREHFNFVLQRDCVGTEIGHNLVNRAVHMSKALSSVRESDVLPEERVDATDCAEKWWSDEPESEVQVNERLCVLWDRLLQEDMTDSCILVTHSNLIKAILHRFARVTNLLEELFEIPPDDEASPSTVASEDEEEYDCPDSPVVHQDSWQLLESGCEDLQRLKVERLQNCGVLGLRCVLEDSTDSLEIENEHEHDHDNENDWTIVSNEGLKPRRCPPRWVAKDALLMFGSALVQ